MTPQTAAPSHHLDRPLHHPYPPGCPDDAEPSWVRHPDWYTAHSYENTEQPPLATPQPQRAPVGPLISILVAIAAEQAGIALQLFVQTFLLARLALSCNLRSAAVVFRTDVQIVAQLAWIWVRFWCALLRLLPRAAFVVAFALLSRLLKALDSSYLGQKSNKDEKDGVFDSASSLSCRVEEFIPEQGHVCD